MAHTDIKRVWGQTLATQQESAATVQGIERDLAQAIGAGTATLGELNHQATALGNIERNMDSMAASLGGADRALSAMESPWTPWAWLFGGSKAEPEPKGKEAATTGEEKQSENVPEQTRTREEEGGFRWPWSKAPAEVQAQQGEIDRGVDSVAQGVAHLKGLALGLGETLDSHNQQLDRLGTKAEDNVEGVRQANRRVDRLL